MIINRLLLLTLLLPSFLSSQDRTEDLAPFHALDVAGSFEVKLYEGDPRAEITMQKGEVDEVIVEVSKGVLRLRFKNKKGLNFTKKYGKKAIVDLYVKDLDEIDSSAGASVRSDYMLTADHFEIDASSGSSIHVDLETNNLEVDISSGASVHTQGSATSIEIDCSSGAAYNGKQLEAATAEVEASSGASAKVWVTDRLDADASSGASIRYKGNPQNKNLDPGKMSGGSIRPL